VKPAEEVVKKNMMVYKHKALDKYWHPQSCLVFQDQASRLVIGKADGDKLLKLSEKDVQTCKEYGFTYEESAVGGSILSKITGKSPKKHMLHDEEDAPGRRLLSSLYSKEGSKKQKTHENIEEILEDVQMPDDNSFSNSGL
jgi:hypothetical protein